MMTAPSFAEIQVVGADARSFLHSQLASDIRPIEPLQWRFGCYCLADGRVQALMLVACESADVWRLLLPAELAAAVTQRLQRFKMRARCSIENADVSIVGSDHPSSADAAGYECAAFGWRVVHGPAVPLPPALWAQQLHLGVPWLVAATSERFLPQMLALERLHAYSLRKGCFPGQEIVARTHYLGRSKRRLVRIMRTGDGDDAEPGSNLCAIGNDQIVGILLATADATGGLSVVADSATGGMPIRTCETLRSATFVIESDVIETISDASLNGRYHPHSAHGVAPDKMV